jgi:hypothetical protein
MKFSTHPLCHCTDPETGRRNLTLETASTPARGPAPVIRIVVTGCSVLAW